MKNKYYTSRDPIKNYFPLPNEVFALGLSPGALAVYSYLMYIEDRTTYQCHASYLRTFPSPALSRSCAFNFDSRISPTVTASSIVR